MSDTRTIGGEQFTRRKVVRSVQIELEAIQDEVADAIDESSGVEAESAFVGSQIDALATAESFDKDRRDELIAERRELRKQSRAHNSRLVVLQARALATRLEPQPDPEWLLDNTDNADFTEIVGWLDEERPTEPPASESASN